MQLFTVYIQPKRTTMGTTDSVVAPLGWKKMTGLSGHDNANCITPEQRCQFARGSFYSNDDAHPGLFPLFIQVHRIKRCVLRQQSQSGS